MASPSYPDWCSELDQQVIDAALAEGELLYRVFTVGVPESVALERVLAVAEVVASRLPHPFPATHRPDLDRLLADIIGRGADLRMHPQGSIAAFETRIRNAVAASTWWPVTKARCRPSSAQDSVSRRKARRESVVLPLLEELDWTPTRWATEAGLSPHVTINYLDGSSALRKTTRARLTYVLATALHRKLQLPD